MAEAEKDISKYGDISLEESNGISAVKHITMSQDIDIKYDWFNFYLNNHDTTAIYIIKNKDITVGYISAYGFDHANLSADIYGYIAEEKYSADLLKSLISLMHYLFDILKLNKVSFKYREDNYFFDNIVRYLAFIKEGISRERFLHEGKRHNIIIYSVLAHEFRRLSANDYRQMYTWNYNYTPHNFRQVDITGMMDCRAFTNNLENPNRANLNDLKEFVLNANIPPDNYLYYKNAKFHVNIFDTASQYDNFTCHGQEMEIPGGNYRELLIVTMAQFGYQDSYIKLVYDDSTQEQEFKVSDWCERVLRNEYIICYASGCRDTNHQGNVIKSDSFLYLKKVELNSDKQLKKIVFPNRKEINIFAVGLCQK